MLSEEQFNEAMKRRKNGETLVALAKEYGVKPSYFTNRLAKTNQKKKKALSAHSFQDIPLMPADPVRQLDGRVVVAIVPTTSLRNFLSEVLS